MKVLLIRHARTTSNAKSRYMGHIDEELPVEVGPQLDRIATRLADESIQAIYASPMRRARQTACPASETFRLPIVTMDAFNEMRMGPWEGLTASEIEAQYPNEWSIWRQTPDKLVMAGREPLQDAQARAVDGIRRVAAEGFDVVAIFTHDVIVRLVLAFALGCGPELYRRIPSTNCSISSIRYSDSGLPSVELMNETHFLVD